MTLEPGFHEIGVSFFKNLSAMPQDSFEVSQTSLEVKELQLEFGEFGKFVKNIKKIPKYLVK